MQQLFEKILNVEVHTLPLSALLEEFHCDNCKKEKFIKNVWVSDIDSAFTLCDKCYTSSNNLPLKEIICHCLCREYHMFRTPEEMSIKCSTNGYWYFSKVLNERLCQYHGDKLLQSKHEYASFYEKIEDRDVKAKHLFSLDIHTPYYVDNADDRNPAIADIIPKELRLPSELLFSVPRILKLCKVWFGKSWKWWSSIVRIN